MFYRMFDYYTEEKQLLDEIQTQLAARTPEEVAADEKKSALSFQRIMEIYERRQITRKRVPNKDKYRNFLQAAEQMRQYTAIHTGKISIRAEEGGIGMIEMFFENLFHTDLDSTHSNLMLGLMLMRYRETSITAKSEGIAIQVFAELYDEIPVDGPETDHSPS